MGTTRGNFTDSEIAEDSSFMGRIRWIVEEISNDGITQKYKVDKGEIDSVQFARNLTQSRADAARAIRRAVIEFLSEYEWDDDDDEGVN